MVLATDMSKAFHTPQQIRQRLHQLNCFGMQLFLNYSKLFEIVQINLNLSKLDYLQSEIVSVYNYFQIRKNRIFIWFFREYTFREVDYDWVKAYVNFCKCTA